MNRFFDFAKYKVVKWAQQLAFCGTLMSPAYLTSMFPFIFVTCIMSTKLNSFASLLAPLYVSLVVCTKAERASAL